METHALRLSELHAGFSQEWKGRTSIMNLWAPDARVEWNASVACSYKKYAHALGTNNTPELRERANRFDERVADCMRNSSYASAPVYVAA